MFIILKIGCHLSVSGGFFAMGKNAVKIGANVFQFFTRNPRGSAAKAIDPDDIAAFRQYSLENGLVNFLGHAPYTLNAASFKEKTREFAIQTFIDDLARMEHLPGSMYNFHPGSYSGQSIEEGADKVAELLNLVLHPELTTTVLLETMSGRGSELGGRFEELKMIIDKVNDSDKLGVCMDTCHVFDAGYDLANDLGGVLDEFDRIIGLERLKAIHLNDSKNPAGSKKDRHAAIGDGFLGVETFSNVINHPALKDLPFYLETPNDLDGYAREISLLRSLYKH